MPEYCPICQQEFDDCDWVCDGCGATIDDDPDEFTDDQEDGHA